MARLLERLPGQGGGVGIAKPWSRWAKKRVDQHDDNYGAYELGDSSGEILYVGSGRIRSRLLDHFPPGRDTKPGVSRFRVEYKGSRRAARGRERRLLFNFRNKHGRLPKFNDGIPPAL